jgi:hypothetical protein
MSRIISQHGNVISADFSAKPDHQAMVTIKSETLYYDGSVMLTRTTALLNDKPISVLHFLGDLAAGRIVQL